MPANFETEDDFLLVDDLEDLLWLRQDADGEFAAGVEVRGYRQTPKRKTASLIENVDAIWHLHRPDMPEGSEIVAADRIQRVSDDSVWVVQWCDENGYEDQFRVGTTKAVVT
jgi:hypothetical protein